MFFDIAFVFYLLALLHSMLYFFLGYKNLVKVLNFFVVLGLTLNTIFLVKLFALPGNSPFDTIGEIFVFLVFSINIFYLIIYWLYKRPLLYFALSPIILILSIVSIFTLDNVYSVSVNNNFWLYIHLPFVIFGTSLFLMSAITGIIYFLQEKQLKKKNFGLLFNKFPPLETINKLNNFTLLSGFSFYTIGVISGFIWSFYLLNFSFLSNPKILFAMISWCIFGAIILLKLFRGLSPKNIAFLSILGFISICITYLVVILLMRG
ncbi:cytochrome c biogenesis protein CcsA [Deferribacter thermophilus]|uniref:cytochrome c biogenesis protein CcsA n=1 Tax=Deferribacter thermophilus TaxID=53573 RepID=UPI003C1FED64